MPKTKQDTDPAHGFCTLCKGPIVKGVQWTLTGMMNRIHSDPDDCIAVLRPSIYKRFIKANPRYVSKHRYQTA